MQKGAAELLTQQRKNLTALERVLQILAESDLPPETIGYFDLAQTTLCNLFEIEDKLQGLLGGRSEARNLKRAPKILCIDEDPLQHAFLRHALTPYEIEVVAASSAQKALELLRSEHVDLIVMECQLRGIDGFELTEKIRGLGIPSLKSIPIVAHTVHGIAGYKERCLSVGMSAYIKKPVAGPVLAQRLADLLNLSGAAPLGTGKRS